MIEEATRSHKKNICPSLFRVCVCVHPLQVITLEGWVDIMYYVMDAHSFYNFIYFIFLIIVSAGDSNSNIY